MEKMQILFPENQLKKLRSLSKDQDRPVSELVRSAVDFYLSRQGSEVTLKAPEDLPVYSCGAILQDPSQWRETAYSDRETR